MAEGSRGSNSASARPTTSGIAPASAARAGQPQAIASRIGSPKPSASDGKHSTAAEA